MCEELNLFGISICSCSFSIIFPKKVGTVISDISAHPNPLFAMLKHWYSRKSKMHRESFLSTEKRTAIVKTCAKVMPINVN